MGRKNKYFSNVQPRLKEIQEWIQTHTEAQIAKRLGVSLAAFANYKNDYPELREALQKGTEELVICLKESLKKKAKGFRYTEKKKTIRTIDGKETKVIEEYDRYSPPDVGAIHLLLKNLDDTWRNDDKESMELKREKLELEKKKAETENW